MKYKIFITFILLLQQPFLSYANEQVDMQEESFSKKEYIINVIYKLGIKKIIFANLLFFILDNIYTFSKDCNSTITNNTSPGLLAAWAIKHNHLTLLRFLIKNCKINPNFRSTAGLNLLEIAAKYNNPEAAKVLVENGANVFWAIKPIYDDEETFDINTYRFLKLYMASTTIVEILSSIFSVKTINMPIIFSPAIILTPYHIVNFCGWLQQEPLTFAYQDYLDGLYRFLYKNDLFTAEVAQKVKKCTKDEIIRSINCVPSIILETDSLTDQIEKLEKNNLNDTQREILNELFYNEKLDLNNFNLEKYKNNNQRQYQTANKETFSEIYTAITKKQNNEL